MWCVDGFYLNWNFNVKNLSVIPYIVIIVASQIIASLK